MAAVDLIVEIIINAAIQESKGEFKGTPSSEIVPYDPKHDKPENNRDEKVCYEIRYFQLNSQAPDVPELAHQGIFQLSRLSVNCYVKTVK